MVLHTKSSFTNAQGLRVHTETFIASDARPRGAIICLHGVLSHHGYSFLSRDYTFEGSVLEAYTKKGLEVVCLDHQGHGRSGRFEGKLGHVRRIRDVVNDALSLVEEVSRRGHTHIFMHGHSFGGMVTLLAAQSEVGQRLLDGILLTSPAVAADPQQLKTGLNRFLLRLVAILSACWPTLPIASMEENTMFPELQERFEQDPLCYTGAMRARFAAEFLKTFAQLETSLSTIRVPFIAFHGSQDSLNSPEGTSTLFREASSTDKTLVLVENMWHDLLLEPGGDDIARQCAEWAEARCEPLPAVASTAAAAAAAAAAEVPVPVPSEGAKEASSRWKARECVTQRVNVPNGCTPAHIGRALESRQSLWRVLEDSTLAKVDAVSAFGDILADVREERARDGNGAGSDRGGSGPVETAVAAVAPAPAPPQGPSAGRGPAKQVPGRRWKKRNRVGAILQLA